MKTLFAVLVLAALPAWAQSPKKPLEVAPKQVACADCGVVRSVRAITKDVAPAAADSTKPSGLVATIPLGKGAGSPKVGSSTHVGKDTPTRLETWEVIVLLDDGRLRVVVMDEPTDLRAGDKVRVDQGRVVRRTD